MAYDETLGEFAKGHGYFVEKLGNFAMLLNRSPFVFPLGRVTLKEKQDLHLTQATPA